VQESILADHQLRRQSPEAQPEASRPQKRRKVRTNPNSKFADIEAIKKAQDEAAGVTIDEEVLGVSSISDLTEDCTVVGD
jgi:hypothetical protein